MKWDIREHHPAIGVPPWLTVDGCEILHHGHDSGTDSLEVPTIYKAFSKAYMVLTYLHYLHFRILKFHEIPIKFHEIPWNSHILRICDFPSKYTILRQRGGVLHKTAHHAVPHPRILAARFFLNGKRIVWFMSCWLNGDFMVISWWIWNFHENWSWFDGILMGFDGDLWQLVGCAEISWDFMGQNWARQELDDWYWK